MPEQKADSPASHTRAAFSSACTIVSLGASKIPGASLVSDYLCGRVEDIWRYQEVRGHLHRELAQKNNNYDDPTVRFFIDEIIKTADFGAKRANFKKYYVDGKRLHLLPEDPRSIIYGHW